MELRKIDAALLPAFRPYLVAEAAEMIGEEYPHILAFGAVTGDYHTCAAIAGEVDGGVLTVFSLMVDPAVRRQGVASMLLDALAAACPGAAVEAGWFLSQEGWDSVEPFFRAKNFEVERGEDRVYRLDTAHMHTIPVIRRAFSPTFKPDGNVVPLSALTEEELAAVNGSQGVDPRLLPAALRGRCRPEGSFAYRYNGRISAWFLCGQTGGRDVAILSAVSLPGTHPAAFLQLAAAATNWWLSWFGGEYTIWLDAISEDIVKLANTYSGNTCTLWQEGHAIQS